MAINALDGRFIDINLAALHLFGLRREEVIGRTSSEVGLVLAEDPGPGELAMRVRARGPVRNESRTIRSRSGELRDVELMVDLTEIRGESCFVSTFFDVTEHKRSVDELVSSESHYRWIVETAREGICISDTEDRFTFVNSRMAEVLGYRPDELVGMSVFAITDTKDHGKLVELRERRRLGIAEGGEFKVKHRDGHELWVRFESRPVFDGAGRYTGVLTSILDITDRILAEERLKKSEAQLEEAQALAHVGSWEWDLVSDTVNRSKELCRIFGMCPESFGTSLSSSYERVHPDDREKLHREIDLATRERRPWEIEYRIVRPDGVRTLLARGKVITDDQGRPVRMVGTAQDVTERRAMQAHMVLADRMASVGTLAAGVAHEINNPLAFVIGNLDLVAEAIQRSRNGGADDLGAAGELLREAREGAERVRKIVRDLKIFSRADEDRRVPLDPRRVLDLAVNVAAPQVRYRARIVKDYGDVPNVEADEARLGQVFVNLLVNAAHAIPEGQADRHTIGISTLTNPDGSAVIEIRDTGSGIPVDVLGHVFDPFFTTKPIGVGSGLGLSICHGIVTALGGEISVESEVGRGSIFRVVLPPGRARAVPEPDAREVPGARVERRRRILVIDDEPLIGKVIRRILLEHDVTIAHGGKEGLARVTSGEPFDLILCDLMMPEMTGMDLHAELSRSMPELLHRVVFMTGGVFSSTAKAFLDRVPNERLEKPFEPARLAALARRAPQ
jgi:PAS domain S-box-containing protein